ncbi:uncharacterized protein LOC135693286 isoform X2 [Rhopilema esculentum]|uniref:uncharacterized protein LOC135693286 isoform X2 n=1 Tax=Rhopilema esculentum TaxID=499914 RepID=UPI0031D0C241
MASVPLKQLQVGSKLNTPVYGVVTAFQCPKIDCNGNYYSTITIKDPSLEKEDGICCFFFQKSEENLPKIKTVGDVVRLKGLYVTMFKRCRQLKARPNCSWVVAHPDGAIDLFSYKADKSDMEKLKQLSDWGDKLEQVKAARRITLLSDIEPDNKYVNVLVELFSADHNKVDKNSYVLRVWDGTVPKCNSFFYGLQEGFNPEKTQTRDIPKYIEKRLMYIILYGGHIQKGLEANPGNVLRITNLNQRPLPQDTLDDLLSNESIPKKHSTKPWVCCALSEKNSYGRGLEIIDENGLEALKLKEKLAVVSETAEDSDESSIESGDGNVDVQDENEQLAMQQFRDEWRIHRESSASSFVSPWHLDEAEEPQAARILPRADNFEPVLDIQSADANRPVTEIQSTQRSRTNAEQHSQPSSSRRSLLDDMELAREWTRLSDIKPDGKCINILVQVVSVHLSVFDSSCLILRVWDGTQPNCQSFSYGRTKDFKHVNDVPRHVKKRSISVSLHGNHVANGLEAVPGDFVKIRQMRQCGISNEDLEVSLARGFVPEKRKRSSWVFCVLEEGSSHGQGLEIVDKKEQDALKLKRQLADVFDVGEDSDEERDRGILEEVEEGRVDRNRKKLDEGTEDDTGDDTISESLLSPVLLNTLDWDISFNESFENQMVINEPQAAKILPRADNFEPVLDIQSADANRPVTEIQSTQRSRTNAEQHSQPSSSRRSLLDDMQLAREWTRLSDIKPDGKCINILVQVVSVHLSVSDSSCLILRVWDGTQPNCQSFSYGRTKDFKHVNDVPRHVEKRSISVSLHGNHVANGLEAVPGDFVKIRHMRQCGISNEDLEVSLARGFVPEKRKRSPWVFCVLDEGSSHGRGLEIIDKGERDALKLKTQLADVCDIGEESDEERDRDSSEEIEEGRVDGNREELNEGTEDDTGDDAISESLLSPVLLNTQDWDISFNESFENQMVINEPQAARILPPADNFEPVLDIQSADANRPVTEIQNTQSLNRTEEQANVDGKYLGSPVREYSLQSTVMPQKENHTPRRKQRQLENEERHRSSVGKYSLRSRATPRKENHTPARKQRQLEDEERHRSPVGKYSLQATATPRKENYTPRRKQRQLEDEERHSMSVGKYSLRSTFTPRKENHTPARKQRQLEDEERHRSPLGKYSLQATATPRKENNTPRRKKRQLEDEERHRSPVGKYSLRSTFTPRKENHTPARKQRQLENEERHRSPLGKYSLQATATPRKENYTPRRKKRQLEDEERHSMSVGKYSLRSTFTPRKENYTPRRKKRQLENEERHKSPVGNSSLQATATPRKENYTPRRKKKQLENEERHKSPVGNSSLQATATPRKKNGRPRKKQRQLENEESHRSPLRKYSLQATATPRKKNGTPRKKQRQSENGEIYNYQIRSKTNSRRYYLRRRKEELAR